MLVSDARSGRSARAARRESRTDGRARRRPGAPRAGRRSSTDAARTSTRYGSDRRMRRSPPVDERIPGDRRADREREQHAATIHRQQQAAKRAPRRARRGSLPAPAPRRRQTHRRHPAPASTRTGADRRAIAVRTSTGSPSAGTPWSAGRSRRARDAADAIIHGDRLRGRRPRSRPRAARRERRRRRGRRSSPRGRPRRPPGAIPRRVDSTAAPSASANASGRHAQASRTIVTGPSLTSETSMRAPKTPRCDAHARALERRRRSARRAAPRVRRRGHA